MAETPTWPLFVEPQPGDLHVRTFDPDVGTATRSGDAAALAIALLEANFEILVVTSGRTPDMVNAIGYGWHHPQQRVFEAGTLLEVTAELYDLWSRGVERVAIVFEDWMKLATGPARGHDDADGRAWVSHARTACIDGLEALTGLSYNVYLRDRNAYRPTAGALVTLGTRTRRGGDARSGGATMGGVGLRFEAETTCAVQADGYDADFAYGTATLLKCRRPPVSPQMRIMRAGDRTSPWVVSPGGEPVPTRNGSH